MEHLEAGMGATVPDPGGPSPLRAPVSTEAGIDEVRLIH